MTASIHSFIDQSKFLLGGVVLSCGPSQIYGVIKGGADLAKLAKIKSKIHQWESIKSLCQAQNFEKLIKHKKFSKTFHSDSDSKDHALLFQKILQKSERKLFELNQEKNNKQQALKVDLTTLVPFAGTLLAYKLASPTPSQSSLKSLSLIPLAIGSEESAKGSFIP